MLNVYNGASEGTYRRKNWAFMTSEHSLNFCHPSSLVCTLIRAQSNRNEVIATGSGESSTGMGQPPYATPEESSMGMGQPPEGGGFNLLSPVTGQAVSQTTLFRQWSHDIQDRNTRARLASSIQCIMGDAGTTHAANIGPLFAR